MEYDSIAQYLIGLWPYAEYVLMGLGALVIMGGVYVKMTPNQDDDAMMAKVENMAVIGSILKLLVKFSPIARK